MAAGNSPPRNRSRAVGPRQLRFRLEAPAAPDCTARSNDLDLLTRLRIGLRLNAGRRLRLAAEWQDARGFGDRPKAPASLANRLDLRLA